MKARIKRLAVFLMLLDIFLLETSYTDADIFAERIVKNNSFSAISIDFSLKNSFSNGPISYIFQTLGIQPGGYDLGAMKINSQKSEKIKYHMKAVRTNGDDSLCDQLNIKVLSRNFSNIFSGPLTGLSLDSTFSDSAKRDYIFFASLDNDSAELKNKICEFNLSIKTYRHDPEEQGGIFAERMLGNVISSGNW